MYLMSFLVPATPLQYRARRVEVEEEEEAKFPDEYRTV
jgi:hypothetical protein